MTPAQMTMHERRGELAALLAARWYGVTVREISEALPDWYADAAAQDSAAQRNLLRDLAALVRGGAVVCIREKQGAPGKWAPRRTAHLVVPAEARRFGAAA
jgi:hypothetical protein